MRVGIEKINLYAGRASLDIAELARARGQDPRYVADEIMCHVRSIYPPYEDAVTLAVNAAMRLLAPQDVANIELLIVGTESAVDMGKPVADWVHRFCELSPRCRNLEVKHACYGTTGALKLAASWVASGARPGKKALVINSDLSMPSIGTPHETAAGGCAVAFLVSGDPQVLEIELDRAGYWTTEIADTYRPTPRVEIIRSEVSLFSYLDALDGAFGQYEAMVGPLDYGADFKKHIYHAPFPGMAVRAHRAALERFGPTTKRESLRSFRERVEPSLYFAKRIGTAYGSSTFIGLCGMLASAPDLQPGDRISMFAYGSGCQSELYSARVGPWGRDLVLAAGIDQHLAERRPVTVAEYEESDRRREEFIGRAGCELPFGTIPGLYEEQYAGKRFLTLKSVGEDFQRTYVWS